MRYKVQVQEHHTNNTSAEATSGSTKLHQQLHLSCIKKKKKSKSWLPTETAASAIYVVKIYTDPIVT